MDKKHLDTQIEIYTSDSCEGTDEETEGIYSSNSSEPSLGERYVSEASVDENVLSYENCNIRFDEVGDKSCTATYAEPGMDQSDSIINANENSSYKVKGHYRVFTPIAGQSSSSVDSCAFQSSTVIARELELVTPFRNNSFSYLRDVASSTMETITVDKDRGTFNPLENFRNMESCLLDINHEVERAQSERCSVIDNISFFEPDIIDFSEMTLVNDDAVLTNRKEVEPCPKISPTDDESVTEKSLKDISEVITCSKLRNDNEIISKQYSTLKNRVGISTGLVTQSVNKENQPNKTEEIKNRTFKKSLSMSPTGVRLPKIMKPSSPAESPTNLLRNKDTNLTKRPASPDNNLSPQSKICSVIDNIFFFEPDIIARSEMIVINDDPVLTDRKEVEPCPKISPTDDDSVRKKSLKDISEVMTCSKVQNDNEIIGKQYSTLKNRVGIRTGLVTQSINKENQPNKSEVIQDRTFKRSLSISPTGVREPKIMKPSSPAESPTSLRNLCLQLVQLAKDRNLTKRPASPDNNLSPESHARTQKVKKHKIEEFDKSEKQ